jgi:uncharacterized protein (TIRG00374 family)
MLAMLLVGAALLGFILYRADLPEVAAHLLRMGGGGLVAVLALYLAGSVSVCASWLWTLPERLFTGRWLFRLWRAWMVGSAFETLTPLASLGGEPVKAIVLKRYYGVRYRDASASLVLTRMTDLVAQVVFITTGFALILRNGLLPEPYPLLSGVALAAFVLGITGFFLVQRLRGLSALRGWLERGWLRDRTLSARAARALDAVHDVEDQLVSYYSSQGLRFFLSGAAAFGEWMSGVFATWVAVNLLGHPIGFAEAFVIEAFVALVRSTLFFVPADLGTQEGAHVVICAGITGSAELGLALAAVRRSRDLLFVALGFTIGGAYSFQPRALRSELEELRAAEAQAEAELPAVPDGSSR